MSAATQAREVALAARMRLFRLPEWSVVLLVLGGAVLIAVIPFLQNHFFYYAGDNPESFVPLWHHLGTQLRAGAWHTMEPAGWFGGNYAAESAYALWNPVFLLDYVLVSLFDDLPAAAALVQIQFLALLAAGAYLLFREYGANRIAAVAMSLAVPFTGFTLFYEAAGWPAGLSAFTGVTWFWWAARRQARGHLWPLVTFCVGALAITTGNPYAALGVVIVLLGVGVELLVQRNYRRLAGLVITGVLIGMTTALVYVPLLATLSVTNRQQIAGLTNDTFLVPHLSDMAAGSAPTYLPPILNWGGAVLERLPSTYFAWFVVPLLPWLRWRGWSRTRNGPVMSLLVITGIYAALAVGPSNLWLFRWPIRLIEYLYLGLAALFALLLSRGLARDHVRRRAIASAALVLAGGYLSFAVHPDIYRLHAEATVAVAALVLVAVTAYRRFGLRWAALVLVVGTVGVVTYQTGRLPLSSGGGDQAGTPSTITQVHQASVPYRGTVLQLATESALTSASSSQTSELLFGNETLMSGHESLVRYSGIGFQKFSDALCMDYKGQVCPDALHRAFAPVGVTGASLVDLMKVRTVVLDRHLFPRPSAGTPPPGWSVAFRDSERTVWTRDARPPYAGRLSWASPAVTVTRDSDAGSGETVSFDASAPGTLTFARLDWPGYTATLDGAALDLRNGPAGLVTAQVPAGRHVLALTFRTPGLRWTFRLLVAAALLSVVQTGLGIGARWRRRRRTRRAETQPARPATDDAAAPDEPDRVAPAAAAEP